MSLTFAFVDSVESKPVIKVPKRQGINSVYANTLSYINNSRSFIRMHNDSKPLKIILKEEAKGIVYYQSYLQLALSRLSKAELGCEWY